MLTRVSRGRDGGSEVMGLYDPQTCSIQYVVAGPATRRCALIDPILDFDESSGSTSSASADALLEIVRERNLEIAWILDVLPHPA